MKNIAIIDIGSNSIRLVLVQVKKGSFFKIIKEIKKTVRLGENTNEKNTLLHTKMDMAVETLKVFKRICTSAGVDEIIAVATAAVRKAKNKKEFLNKVKNEIGINIRVLSGNEEAYYAFFGVINSLDLEEGLIMDIGGGSTELILVRNRKLIESVSLPFGSIDLANRFHLYDDVKDKQINAVRDFLVEKYSEIQWLSHVKNIPLIGVGGTIRNISKIHKKMNNYPLKIMHNYRMLSTSVYHIYDLVKSKNLSSRKKIKGLSKERADIFVGATAAVSELINFCYVDHVIISGSGIREGLIYDYILKNSESIRDILSFSIENIMYKHQLNKNNNDIHVHSLTQKLYEQLKPLHYNNYSMEKIIKTSAMLYNSGTNIHYYNHHAHAFYVMLNSGINGLSHKELLISSFIAIASKNKEVKLNWVKYKSILCKNDIELIKKIGLLLRMAKNLDICMNSNIENIECSIRKNEVIVQIFSKNKADTEIKYVLSCQNSFKKIYNKNLTVI